VKTKVVLLPLWQVLHILLFLSQTQCTKTWFRRGGILQCSKQGDDNLKRQEAAAASSTTTIKTAANVVAELNQKVT
jgi:hypothetical protein